ncbi:metallophosphoesterase [Lysobacter sp. TY2-98]|uniref:metallophosphoesterase n=1 Tax=Lysobacter sp. TY2-98 TaxID=2290922 RepID=UPI000E1FC32A|nr:metallophosphoesterase [Lysobacter sp. TY2-98]AXK71341.1 metallophosphoesterase [Lysobacter sp. TY2-98]
MRPALRHWARRLFFAWVAIAFAAIAYGVFVEPRELVERDYTIAIPHWPAACEGLRLDHVSDVHTGSPNNGLENLDRVIAKLVASDSDAVVMTGDYVILSVLGGKYIPADVSAPRWRALTARKPVYAVLGNHDWWKGGLQVRRALEAAGVVVLEDESTRTTIRGCPLWIVGVGDFWTAKHDVHKAFAGVNDDAPAIALTHNPVLLDEIPLRASLLLAGHTHGGQISLPFVGQPAKWGKPENRYIRGFYSENGRELFVSPGIGTSILPMRLGVPPEISRLTLRATR